MKQLQQATNNSVTKIISLDIAQYNKKITLINYFFT